MSVNGKRFDRILSVLGVVLTAINIASTAFIGFYSHKQIDDLDAKIKIFQISDSKQLCLASINKIASVATIELREITKSRYACYKGNLNSCSQSITFKNHWVDMTYQDLISLIANRCNKKIFDVWEDTNQKIVSLDSNSLSPNDNQFLNSTEELNDNLDRISRIKVSEQCCSDN